MTDEQVREVIMTLRDDDCSLTTETCNAIADHLEAGLSDREKAAQDREDAERWMWLDAVVVQKGRVELGREEYRSPGDRRGRCAGNDLDHERGH
jgi:hypothetical protein